MSIKIPNYRLKVDVTVGDMFSESIVPAGTWVKPIDKYYLPQHIKEGEAYRWANHDVEIFCYTSYGIVLIPRKAIVES